MGTDVQAHARMDRERKATIIERAQRHNLTLSDAMRLGAEMLLDELDTEQPDALDWTVTGKAGLPLGDRGEAWDAQAAKNSLTSGQFTDAAFWKDPDKPADQITSFKLFFARSDNGLHAVWRGVTACAVVLQGGRGGVDIPGDEQDRIKGKINGYYAAARAKYDDPSIQAPWGDGGSACVDNVEALALVESWSDDEFAGAVGFAPKPPAQTPPAPPTPPQNTPPPTVKDVADKPHVFQPKEGTPQACAVCNKQEMDDVHDEAMADTPHDAVPMPPSMQTCAVCAQPMNAAVHSGGSDDSAQVKVIDGLEATSVELPDGTRVVFQPVAVPGTGEEGDSPPESTVADIEAGMPFRATLAQEGVATDDGRQIEKGALEWRSLPLTLMAIIEDSHGGMPTTRTVVSGRIDEIERVDTGEATADIIGTGVFDSKDPGAEIGRQVKEKFMRGVSIDMAVKESEELIGDGAEDGVEDPFFGGNYLLVVKKGMILGATVCPFPAFGEADIEPLVAAGAESLPRVAMPSVIVDHDGHVIRMQILGTFAPGDAPAVPPASDPDNDQDNDSDPFSGATVAVQVLVDELPTPDELANVDPTKLAVTYDGNDLNLAEVTLVDGDDNNVDVPLGKPLTASAAGMVPVTPPGAWFDYPDEAADGVLHPLTITKDGRVWGHVAAFNECHIGIPGKCQIAPHHYRANERGICAVCGEVELHQDHSRAAYDYFHLSEIETAEGDLVRVGQLTIGTGHAAGHLSARETQRHYDHTGTAVADIHLYEDEVGVMAAGALRPDVSAIKVRETRGSKPSGDWRIIRGRREMVGLLGTNVPGYTIRRIKIDDDRVEQGALVAAGFVDFGKAGTRAVCREGSLDDLIARARMPLLMRRARELGAGRSPAE